MSKLSKIKERATEIAQQRKQTTDQEQARIERARMEARKEAKREKVQQRAEQAREDERERVLNDEDGGIVSSIVSTINEASDAVDDGDDQRLDDISQAMGTDFDGDGEPFAEELGLQSAARGEAEDDALQGLSSQVDRNSGRIDDLEEMGFEDPARREPQRGRGRGGGGSDMFDGDIGGGVDPADFGFGGDDGDGGLFGGGGGL